MPKTSNERILVIVESPNKIKTLKEILPPNYVIKASVGHISEINDSGLHNFGIDPNDNFKADYQISNDKKDVVKDLKNQVDLCSKVIIATDGDREGEAIAWSLKKFLKIPESKYERVTFHEITEKAVLKAIDNPGKIDDDLVSASQSRQKLDKIVGYRLSPIARRQISARSVGRVQSAGLKLIVEREEEINNFVPETYFDLFLNFFKNQVEFKAKYVGTAQKEIKKLASLDEVKAIVADCKKTNTYTVNDIETKEKLSNPKPPFITSTFQQEVSNKLGIGVKQAMSYAQKLFEGIDVNGKHIALITYIRTDSPEFAPEFLPQLESYVKSNYGDKYYSPIRKGKKAENVQDGHEAIRPVDLTMTPEKLSSFIQDANLVKVYNIIYKRTIATSMASAVTSETTYEIKNDVHLFNLVSKELIFDGYKAVYGSFEDKEEEATKETFKIGEVLKETSLEAIEKKTTPPSRYKEATFIKELESRGIGRPSTFASTVDTILSESRGYCVIEEKFLVPTEKGMSLSHFLDKSFPDIINVNYTSELEENLDLIASGKLNDIDFLTSFYKKLEESVKKVEPNDVGGSSVTDKICPKCGKKLVYRTGKYGPFLGCSGYPSCRHIEKVVK